MNKLTKLLSIAGLIVILVPGMVIATACRAQKPPAATGINLAATMVPNLDLDVYVYIKQDNPTKIPNRIIGVPSVVSVESFAMWGIAADNQTTISGALVLTTAAEASALRGQIPNQAGIWTALADRAIYFVQGSGANAEKLKAAISRNDFKPYNDQAVLAQAARLPDGGNTKLAAIAVVKPSTSMVKLMTNVTGQATAAMVESMLSVAQLQPAVVGLYAPSHIDVADVAQRVDKGTIWEANLGVVALVKSGLPGVVVGPVAAKLLENAGHVPASIEGMSLYKGALQTGSKNFPVFLNLDGNSLSMAASGKEAYAQTLITGIKK